MNNFQKGDLVRYSYNEFNYILKLHECGVTSKGNYWKAKLIKDLGPKPFPRPKSIMTRYDEEFMTKLTKLERLLLT